MKLGLQMGYWGPSPPENAIPIIQEAERLGFDSVWTSEAYGSDALTPLAWWGSHTSAIKLGTAIMQLSARTPTAAAMAALSLDHLSNGRFIMGIGASGPQVVEGWYGQPYPRPLARTREYIDIVRAVLMREEPVSHTGEFYNLPFTHGTGLGKALKSTVHPLRRDLPIFLAAEGPKNVALAAEIADGWFPLWLSPENDAMYRRAMAEGAAKKSPSERVKEFEVISPVPVVIDDNFENAADAIRPMLALYVGGMGAKGANFHGDVFRRLGYEAECAKIQAEYLDGHKDAAVAAVTNDMIEAVALVGPKEKIRYELERWRETVITTLVVAGSATTLRTMAELVLN